MAYYDNVNYPLLDSIPPTAKNILELGCATGVLGAAFKERYPDARWTGIDTHTPSIRQAIPRLDNVVYMDLNNPVAEELDVGAYDAIVMGDVLEHLVQPEKVLNFLSGITTPGATLHICVPNMCHWTVIYRMFFGDITYDPNGLLDKTHLRFMSQASIYKMLLDAGWLPGYFGGFTFGPENPGEPEFIEGLINTAGNLNIPRETIERNLTTFQIVINAVKSPVVESKDRCGLSVIVPMNNPRQFDLNIIRSSGLGEISAQIIPIKDATSAADALEKGKQWITNDWILYCHQDVYVPRGSGHMLANIINGIPPGEKDDALVGFAGVEGSQNVGLVIDRLGRFDFRESASATSIDEFAMMFTRNSAHKIDPNFGWHAWATDLCLNANKMDKKVLVKRVPLFHNSVTPNVQSGDFLASINLLKEKWKGYGKLVATTGSFDL